MNFIDWEKNFYFWAISGNCASAIMAGVGGSCFCGGSILFTSYVVVVYGMVGGVVYLACSMTCLAGESWLCAQSVLASLASMSLSMLMAGWSESDMFSATSWSISDREVGDNGNSQEYDLKQKSC